MATMTRVKPGIWLVAVFAAVVAALTAYVLTTHAPGLGAAAARTINPLFPVSGFIVGVLVGLTGVGGGSLMTPLLVLLFHFHPGSAVGTDLLYASGTKAVGTVVHGSRRTVDWRIAGWLALGSMPATAGSLAVLAILGVNGDKAAKLISLVLGVALVLTAACLMFRTHLLKFATARFGEPSPRTTTVLTVVLGAVLGILITLSSVGAGAIGMTVLLFLYPKTPLAKLVGTDIAHAVPLTLLAGIGHLVLGAVNASLLLWLLVGSIPGIILGSQMSARMPDGALRPILAVVLALVGLKMLF